MRVNLRGGYVRMSEHHLNGPQIRTALQQMRSKGMTKSMRINFFGQTRLSGVPDNQFPKSLPGEFCTETI